MWGIPTVQEIQVPLPAILGGSDGSMLTVGIALQLGPS